MRVFNWIISSPIFMFSWACFIDYCRLDLIWPTKDCFLLASSSNSLTSWRVYECTIVDSSRVADLPEPSKDFYLRGLWSLFSFFFSSRSIISIFESFDSDTLSFESYCAVSGVTSTSLFASSSLDGCFVSGVNVTDASAFILTASAVISAIFSAVSAFVLTASAVISAIFTSWSAYI